MGYLDIAFTPSVEAVQAANGSAGMYDRVRAHRANDQLGPAEIEFIAARDSFYLASVSETGWPYVQHRGGPPGFLRAVDARTLIFADFRGNRQYVSLGNTAVNDRVSLFLIDYPARRRLKIYARLEVRALADAPNLAETLASAGYPGVAERVIVLNVEAFDWNCPQHITPRYTEAQIAEAVAPMRARLAALETENQVLRKRLDERKTR